ncbi:MAG TPA: acyl-CoA dehydrogenase family protein [Polyangia bacterium]|jgi:alkylation response protein AidB-like acyl-CoA dehydrogenase|nr:acyl-CoA dehydrogenase family protein [Polyangia bacterium]
MDFAPSPTLQPLLEQIERFIRDEVEPLEPRFLAGSFAALLPDLERLRARVKALGWWLPQMPRDVGGLGLTLLEHGQVSERLGRSPLGHYLFNCQAPDAGNMEILHRHGTPAQHERWLMPLLRGELRSCFSMTEPELPGSNPTLLATTARKDGDDYVIDGHKWFTSSADGAAFAIVMAVTDADAAPHLRASQIIVPTCARGFTLVRNISVMGHAGDDYASHAEVRYDGVRVPQSNRLGGEGAGFLIAQERLGPGRIHHCMRWIGICERAFTLMCKRAATREVAPGNVLGGKQLVQAWIAESRAEIDAARLMVLRAAWTIDHDGVYAAREQVSLIKFYVAGVMERVLDRALQAHGALGMTDDTPLAWFFRQERAARIYDGPDEVHKMVVAKRILKSYGVTL